MDDMQKTKAEMDHAIAVLAGALNHGNCTKFLKMDRPMQERIIYQAFARGIITYRDRRPHDRLH